MPDILITFYCAATDSEIVAEALRALTPEPIHLRDEQVLDRDFGNARVAEQVRGALKRAAVEVAVPETEVERLIAAVAAARRSFPVRWQTMPVIARGKLS